MCYLDIVFYIDNVVQVVIFNKLKILFENIFLDEFHSFRLKSDCHNVLKNKNKIEKVSFGFLTLNWKNFLISKPWAIFKILSVYDVSSNYKLICKLFKFRYVDIHNLGYRANYNTKFTLHKAVSYFNLE